MPHYLSADQIPKKIRRKHVASFRQRLREALLDPTLTEERRRELEEKIRRLS